MSEPLVIIGNGMAAAKLVENLSARALGRYAIAVIGEEPQLAYNRVLLSSVLANDVAQDDVELKPKRWWRDRGVTVLYGHAATSIDHAIRRVKLASGATIPYSKLVFATGSRPIVLPIPGRELAGVMTFRDMRDVEALKQAGSQRMQCGGDRRRVAGPGSRLRSCEGGRQSHRHSSDGPADGASARCRSRSHAEGAKSRPRASMCC